MTPECFQATLPCTCLLCWEIQLVHPIFFRRKENQIFLYLFWMSSSVFAWTIRYMMFIGRLLNLSNEEWNWGKIEFISSYSKGQGIQLTAESCSRTGGWGTAFIKLEASKFTWGTDLGSTHVSLQHQEGWADSSRGPLPLTTWPLKAVITHTWPWVSLASLLNPLPPTCVSLPFPAPTSTRSASPSGHALSLGFLVLEKRLHILYPRFEAELRAHSSLSTPQTCTYLP